MNRNQNNSQKDISIKKAVQEAYGFSDKELLAEFEETERLMHAGELDGIPDIKAPEREFDIIMEKLQKIKAIEAEETDQGQNKSWNTDWEEDNTADNFDDMLIKEKPEEAPKKSKIIRFTKKYIKYLLMTAAMIGMLWSLGVDATAERNFEYKVNTRSGEQDDKAWNNVENKEDVSSLEEAYDRIHEKLGIDSIQLKHLPEEVSFQELRIRKGHADLVLLYNNRAIHLVETLYSVENSDAYFADFKPLKEVYNEWLDQNIIIKSNQLEDGETEYCAEIDIGKTHFSLKGIMNLDIFEKIVKFLM